MAVAWRLTGAPLLLVVSLYGLYGHLTERAHRNNVLAHGTNAQARVIRSLGIDTVEVQWTDADGREHFATSWVGKPFARQAIGKAVAIKYLAAEAGHPVILSEAAERERFNSWWINSNLGVAGIMTTICIVIGFSILFDKRAEDVMREEGKLRGRK